ncbi:MAG TPA: ribonuclease HII [Pyrinomonadaceae bacterium]|jgi:ribonuclease HII
MMDEKPSLEVLLAEPVAELRRRFGAACAPLPRGLLAALERDPRRGARALARTLRARQRKNRAEGQRLHRLQQFEQELRAQGFELIAGVDEAGMAPLAGPVVAAAVILPPAYKLRGLNDSKKILDGARREELAAQLKQDARAWATGFASVEEIDQLNIYHAGLLAMRRAVEGLSITPDFVLVDARRIPGCPAPQRGIVHGDTLSASIAAASVIAKTTRDAHMRELDQRYPGYGFAAHKGYPTPVHYRALRELGATPVHRRSFAPVRQALGLDPTQAELFPAPTHEQVDAPFVAGKEVQER